MLRSFDIVRDGLGGPRSAFPHTVTLAAGTQAAGLKQNSLAIMKLSNLVQGRHGSKVSSQPIPILPGCISALAALLIRALLCCQRSAMVLTEHWCHAC